MSRNPHLGSKLGPVTARGIVKPLLYISDDSTVAIHAQAYGLRVTAADVAKIRAATPQRKMKGAYLSRIPADETIASDSFSEKSMKATGTLLARLRQIHPERCA